jgi:hypothetical protein
MEERQEEQVQLDSQTDLSNKEEKKFCQSAVYCIKPALLLWFFLPQLIQDGFDFATLFNELISTAKEQDVNEDLIAWQYFLYGMAAALPSSLALTATVHHFANKKHSDHHHHHEEKSAEEKTEADALVILNTSNENETSSHKIFSPLRKGGLFVFEWMKHNGPIALPYFCFGYGATNEVLSAWFPQASQLVKLPFNFVFALGSIYGAVKIHGFNVIEYGGGESASWGKYLTTVFYEFTSEIKSFYEFYVKWGIAIGHLCEGYFAAQLFAEAIGLINLPAFIVLAGIVSLSFGIFEGFTEAISVKNLRVKNLQETLQKLKDKIEENKPRHKIFDVLLEAVTILSSVLHSLPAVYGGSELLKLLIVEIFKAAHLEPEESNFGLTNNKVAGLMALAISLGLLLYPNAYGFYAQTRDAIREGIFGIDTDKESKENMTTKTLDKPKPACCSFWCKPRQVTELNENDSLINASIASVPTYA